MSNANRLAPFPYDCSLDGIGLMLVTDPQTNLASVAVKVKPFEQVAPADYSYGVVPPEIEQATEFRRVLMGMGERREQFKILRRYLYADGIDASINGQLMLGPGFTSITPALTGQVSYWVEAMSGGILKLFQLAGRYVLVLNGGAWTVSQDFGNGVIGVHARRFTPAGYPVRIVTAATNATPISVTAAAHGFLTGAVVTVAGVLGNTAANGNWTITVVDANTFTLNTSVGNGVYTSGGTATQTVTLADSLYVTTSTQHLWQFDGTNDTTNWLDLTALVALDPANQHASYLETHQALLFRGFGNRVVSVSADPSKSANWNAAIAVGDASHAINWLLELTDTLFIFKDDGIWTVDATGISHNLFTGLRVTPSPSNGQNAVVWQNLAYFHFGDAFYSLGPNSSGTIEMHPVGTERFIENDSPVNGRIICAEGWNNWFLFLGMYNSQTGASYLLKYGSWFVDDQPPLGSSAFVRSTALFNPLSSGGSFMEPVIHGAIASFPGKQITSMKVSSIPGPNQRLYLGFLDGSHAWTTLPRGGPNPMLDPACTYAASGSLWYGNHTMNFPSVVKSYRGATVFGTVIDGLHTAEIDYRLPSSGPFTQEGIFTQSGQRINFPNGISGTAIDLLLKLTGPGSSTPMLEGFALHESIRPDLLLERTITLMARDRIARRDGASDWRSAAQLRATLKTTANAKGVVPLVMSDGVTYQVQVGDYSESLFSDQHSLGPAWDITLKAVEFVTADGTLGRLRGKTIGSLAGTSLGQLKGV